MKVVSASRSGGLWLIRFGQRLNWIASSFHDWSVLSELSHRLPPTQLTRWFGLVLFLCFVPNASVVASELDDVRDYFRSGNYEACIELAQKQVDRGIWNEIWPRMLIEARLATGDYSGALESYEAAVERFPDSLRLRLLGRQVYRMNNAPLKAEEQLDILDSMLARTPWKFSNKNDLVPIGEYFLLRGEDPKEVLSHCFDQAIKSDPRQVDAYVATARLALQKNDGKVAAQSLAQAVKLDSGDPEIHFLLSQAWSSSDSERATASLQKALEINANHVPSLLEVASNKIDAEDYAVAEEILSQAESINSKLPRLWAMRAAIAHLQGRYNDEGEMRRRALLPWALNPEVDHTIGKYLSMHYRFQESVEYQRRALKMDENHVPSKTQLAQDLLRLGEMDSGWKLVEEVRAKDSYETTIFNLQQLKAQIDRFTTLEIPGFVIRMDAKEANIYGADVVELLSQAREVLTAKYEVELVEPVYVEIFPRQKDFAVRTFGMPGGEGFLGVCFGRLITANSPAALNVDSNWKSVLWHEYCHVITLQKTKNKMPRWLSEGISVYEERQRDATWGQSLDLNYREMILGEDLSPVSKMSGAFMRPKSPMHLQFAYFESSMVVEYWIKKYGMKSLLRLLDDLAVGMPQQEALKRAPGSLDALDQEFAEYIRKEAEAFGKDVDLERPPKEPDADLDAWCAEHPDSYWRRRSECKALIQGQHWDEALPMVERLIDEIPNDFSSDGPYEWLAQLYRAQERLDEERAAHLTLVNHLSDSVESLQRLIEIDRERGDWKQVADWCERLQAVQPMHAEMQTTRALALEKTEQFGLAVQALKACLQLDPIDPASIHFRLAKALQQMNQLSEAKREVLLALEESPRYREALKLLLEIRDLEASSKVSESQEVSEVKP